MNDPVKPPVTVHTTSHVTAPSVIAKSTTMPEPMTPTKKVELTKKELLLKEIQDILAVYNNREPNIPLNHKYWSLLTQYRAEHAG